MNYREMTKTEKTITTAALDLLAEAEEVAYTRTKKIGICDRCKKSFTKIDARGTRYIWFKKCCAKSAAGELGTWTLTGWLEPWGNGTDEPKPIDPNAIEDILVIWNYSL